jgi:GNAT superfamily N-acetyltransferase
LAGPSGRRAYELNEVSWWSHWTTARWLSPEAYLLTSRDFAEYFFNRGGFLRVTPGSDGYIEQMEGELEALGRKPHLFLRSDQLGPGTLATLQRRGYRIADQMAVMECTELALKTNPGVRVEEVTAAGGRSREEDWARVYLDSFYGDSGGAAMAPVVAIVKRLEEVKGASLLLGTVDGGEPVGVTALFRTGKVCGAYCVGTRRGWRGKRVASTLLAHASSTSEGGKLILQTILSDSLEGFYVKLGFQRAYTKELFVKDAGNAPR